MRILVVDAAVPSLTYHAGLLEKLAPPDTAVDIVRAASGAEALTCWSEASTTNRPFDFILLDAHLPGIDGYAVTEQIRASEQPGEWTPILLLTSALSDQHLARGIAAGADDYLHKPVSPIWLQSKLQAMRRINGIRTELVRMRDALESAATSDSLTGLANRRRFDEVLRQEWLRACRERTPLSLIMLDVDYFKKYNDHYGHHQGDLCLAAVARSLASIVHRPADLVARYGGEEFVMLLPSTPLVGAAHVAQRLCTTVADQGVPHAQSPIARHVTISVGVAADEPALAGYCGGDGIPVPALALLQRADKALYAAKRAGRNQVMTATLAEEQA